MEIMPDHVHLLLDIHPKKYSTAKYRLYDNVVFPLPQDSILTILYRKKVLF